MGGVDAGGTDGAGKKQLLLVEDEFLIRLMLAESLIDAGYDVSEAGDADEALARLADGPVDVLLTDVQLPGPVDGTALARRAREERPALPVIFMTGRAEPGAADLPGEGAVVVIAKPYLPSEVCAAVARLLAG